MAENANVAHIIKKRWSPRAFDPSKPVEYDKLISILEAARWAPSSSNIQPWSFMVGYNFNDCHKDILSTLRESNQIWAKHAPVLIMTVTKLSRNDRPNRFAFHDVGLATENLFLQAYEVGLSCHFMGGFMVDDAREVLNIPPDYEPVAVGAIGYLGDMELLNDDLKEREALPRERKPLEEFVFGGKWGDPLVP